MKIILRVKHPETGRYRLVRCECCNQPRVFPSWKQAGDWAKEHGYTSHKRKRIMT